MSRAYWCLRGILHWLFNIHWYTTMDIGSNDPYEHCEFCGKSRRMRDQCAEDKHYWVKCGERGTYLVTTHFVCLACQARATSEQYFG